MTEPSVSTRIGALPVLDPRVLPLLRPFHHPALPEPSLSLVLRGLRRELCDHLLVREAGRVAAVQALWEEDRAAARPVLATLVDELIAELRAKVSAAARRRSPLHRAAAAIDRRMPVHTVELMDRDEVEAPVKERIITDLEQVQELIGTYERLLGVAASYLDPDSRILDVASGHGGLPAWLAEHAREQGLAWQVVASDVNPAFVELAVQQAASRGLAVQGRVLDALDMDLEPGSVDLVTCTAAIHHLSHGQVAVLFAEALRIARRGVVFLDGYRSPTQLAVALGLFSLTGASRHTLHDAAVSVRKMFVPEELGLLAACTPGARQAVATWVPPGWTALHGPGRAG